MFKEMFIVYTKTSQEIMQEVFQIKDQAHYFLRNQRYFVIPTLKSVNYGLVSIMFLGPKIRESFPNNLKNKESIESFKMTIKEWKPESCPCRLCKTNLQNIGYLYRENKIPQIQTRTYFFLLVFLIDFLSTKNTYAQGIYDFIFSDLFFNVFLFFYFYFLSQGFYFNQHIKMVLLLVMYYFL